VASRAALTPLLARAGLTPGSLALRDASGLSPLDRLQPSALSRLFALVGQDPRFAPILSGLPVAGFDGTLAKRYRTGPAAVAAGSVRAKTGTLNGVSALAGLVRTRSGRLLAFDATANGVALTGTLDAQGALDRIAAVLAGCGCT
jgi:D-alanyl-D-alanine carboxypeptidase/D-alanyl-D-alanine-endopeptidase (penicillin-binding protein 4)